MKVIVRHGVVVYIEVKFFSESLRFLENDSSVVSSECLFRLQYQVNRALSRERA